MTPKRELQESLVDYLNTGLDPYDFGWLISTWDESKENDFEALTDSEQSQFRNWVLEQIESGDPAIHNDPYAPAYLYFSNAETLRAGEWFVHFTQSSPFFSFEHGATAERLQLTRHYPDSSRMGKKVKCPQDPRDGIFSTAYGFAFHASDAMRHTSHYAKKYGRNAVLFKHAHAVSAHHAGDQEHQVIFPICDEYDVVPIYDVVSECLVPLKSGERTFDSLKDIIAWFDGHRVTAQFDGLTSSSSPGRGYWAPGVSTHERLTRNLFPKRLRR